VELLTGFLGGLVQVDSSEIADI
jgi:hypothetical protein